ncbi:MAG: hypothetical protein JXR91_01445, partial [Deltaproteobacteria bacterium]|nr:hypothetical protein [Deltaproteobacteria bacterium]
MNKSFVLILLFLFIEACQPKVSCEPCPVCLKCPSCENAEKSLNAEKTLALKAGPEAENSKKNIDKNAYNWFVIHVTDGDTLVVKQELE